MPYILSIVIVAIAVVLGIFTGVWGGLVWLVVAAIVLTAVFAIRARNTTVQSSRTMPACRPRAGSAARGTANERVGQG